MTLIYINGDPIEQEGLDIEGFKELISQLGEDHTYSKYINYEEKIGSILKDIKDQSKPIYFFTYKSLELVFQKLKKCQEENQILQSQNQSYEFNQQQLFEMTQQELAFHNGVSQTSCEKCSQQQEIKDNLEKMKLIGIRKQNENEYLLKTNKILELENELKINDESLKNYLDQLKNCQSLKQLEEKLNETKQQNLDLQTLKTILTRQNLELEKQIQAKDLYDERESVQQLKQKLEQKNQEIDRVKNIIISQDQVISEYQQQSKIKNKCIQCEKVIITFERLIKQNQQLQQSIQQEKTINQNNYEVLNNYDQKYFQIVENKNQLEKQVIEIIQSFSPYQNTLVKNISQKLNEFVQQNEKFYTELEKVRKLNAKFQCSSIKQIGQQSVIRKQVI